MAQQVFAYIIHKDGVADDTALELIAAARKIDPDASVTAVIAGAGAELDAVCNELVSSFTEVWKIDNEALAYVNAEVIRGVCWSVFCQKTASFWFPMNILAWIWHRAFP